MMRMLCATALIAGLVLTAGCMQFDYGITLDEDLSGTADVNVAIDLERIAYLSAYVENAFSGEAGEPSEEQVAEARRKLLAELDEENDFSDASLRAEVEPDLPEGVTLVDAAVSRDTMRSEIRLRLAFEHVERLRDLRIDDDDVGGGAGAPVDSEPFGDLEIVEEGDAVIVRSQPINPFDEMEDLEEMPWGTDELVEKLLEGFSVSFRLTSPFHVAEHNATRREGRSLVWDFNLETLKAGEVSGIYARLER